MSRSLKKGPYINVSLEKKILAMNESGKKNVVKTWARASMEECRQDMGQSINDFPGLRGTHCCSS